MHGIHCFCRYGGISWCYPQTAMRYVSLCFRYRSNDCVVWITVLKSQEFKTLYWLFRMVIHRQNDGWLSMPDSRTRRISVIIELSKKEFGIMAVKYTEEQLNRMDKSLLITMFLGLQEQSGKRQILGWLALCRQIPHNDR